MVDNVSITSGAGTTIAADDVDGVKFQRVKPAWGVDGVANDVNATTPLPVELYSGGSAVTQAPLGQATMAASVPVAISSNQTAIPTLPASGATISVDVTRPGDTTAYAAGDAWSDSTSAPASGGFTLAGMGRVSGGSGIITDAVLTTSADAATLLQGEIWLFDTSVTNVNDNSAFAVSDAEIKTYVGKIPFVLEDAGNNGAAHLTGLNLAYTCVGSANLRFLVKVKNAYTPVSAEVLTVRLKIIYTS